MDSRLRGNDGPVWLCWLVVCPVSPHLWIADQVRNDGPGWLVLSCFTRVALPPLWIADQVRNDGSGGIGCLFWLVGVPHPVDTALKPV